MHHRFWTGKRVLITGGSGFIGSHLTDRLLESGAALTLASRSGTSRLHRAAVDEGRLEHLTGDLRDRDFAQRCTRDKDIVFHFASKIAGLGYNAHHPSEMLVYNTMLDLQVLDAAARNGASIFFYPSGALVYDNDAQAPIRENASVSGDPVEACRGASWAKRLCERAAPLFQEQHGMHVIIARLSNLYGPGDDFEAESAHLIGNTIRLVAQGEAPEIWGDGSQLRSYLYVTTAVEAILRLTEADAVQGPINIGGQVEYSVRDIVDLIIGISGQPLQAIFHPEHPTGLNRKLLDITRLQRLIGLEEDVSLKEGLQRTYDWYLGSKHRRPPQAPPCPERIPGSR